VIRPSIVLPTMPAGANPEGIEAAAETAERLGWHAAWTTDHVIVPHATEADYGEIFDVLVALGWVGARHSRLALGTSVIVVPMRNPVVLAKQLATLDALSGGRVVAGVGVGWNEVEFANVGEADRFRVRGAFLDETIRLWRHLWSGTQEPFGGRFIAFEDFTFGPLPVQGAGLPIVIGGRSDAALRRAGRLGDGFHASSMSPDRLAAAAATVRGSAADAGRPEPSISARVSVRFSGPAPGSYGIVGDPEAMQREVRAFVEAGATEIAFAFGQTDAERARNDIERFDRDVMAAFR
jgi:probable F420-dependent oxidoreductase